MKSILFLFLILFSSFSLLSQVQVELKLKAKNHASQKKEAGVTIRVLEGSSVVQSGITPANGELKFKVPSEKTYKVEYSKSGFVTRFFTVNTTKIDVELLQGASTPFVQCEVSMIQEVQGVDYSYIKNNSITNFYFDSKSYELAFNESSASKMAVKVEAAVAEAEKKSSSDPAAFNKLVKEGSDLANQKKYAEAIAKYEAALKLPGFETDANANSELIRLSDLLAADKKANLLTNQANQKYNNLIAAAETLRSQKKYPEAILKFEEAYQEKPEQYVLDEIENLEDLIAAQEKEKANQKKYDDAMAAAEVLMKQKSYKAARDQYTVANKAKPSEQLPITKLAEVNKLIEGDQALADAKKKYTETIEAADALFIEEKWDQAKAKYQEAFNLEKASNYPTERIKLIDVELQKIAAEKAKQEKIATLLVEGQKELAANKLDPAELKYKEVIGLDAENTTAKAKLEEIKTKKEEAKKNQERDANFAKLVLEGDNVGKVSKWQESIDKYTQALALKPDAAVEQKKKDAEAKLAESKSAAEKKQNYDAAMLEGENLLKAGELENAKTKFQAALAIDNTQKLPTDKITFIDAEIAKLAASKQAKELFEKTMKAGNDLLVSEKLTDARAKFVEAQNLDKTSTEPKQKIDQIDALIKAQADAKSKTEKFNALIKAGDDLFLANKFDEAKAKYTEAQKEDTQSPVPPQKIEALNQAKSAFEAAQKELQAQKEIQEKKAKYDAAMIAAEKLYSDKKVTDAIAKFEEAKGIDPSQTLPQTRIDALNAEIKALADSKVRTEKFNSLIQLGDKLIGTNQFDEAIVSYIDAKNTDPQSPIPAQKIEAANQAKIAFEKAKQEQLSQKEQQEKKAKFDAAMIAAEKLFSDKKLTEARAKFVEAKDIDAAQTTPQVRIDAIDAEIKALAENKAKSEKIEQLLATAKSNLDASKFAEAISDYQAVLDLDNTNKPAQTGKADAEKKLIALQSSAEQEKQFQALKKRGTEQFADKKWLDAKKSLTDAQSFRSDADIEKTLKQIQENIDAEQKALTDDNKYKSLLQEGEQLTLNKRYDEAIAKYEAAKAIKSSETLPQTKINEINELKKLNAAQVEIDQKYKAEMAKGDKALTDRNYLDAIKFFNEANRIKPSEQEPIDKANEARRFEKENSEDEDRNYQKVLQAGQDAINNKDWGKAKGMYTRAIELAESLKKDKTVPESKLIEIDKLQKAEEDANKLNAELEKNYTSKMTAAETETKSKAYDKAISLYEDAKKLKPQESLPQQRINEIAKLKASEQHAAQEQTLFDAAMKKGESAFKNSDFKGALSHFQDALNVKSADQNAKKRFDETQKILDDIANSAQKDQLKAAYDALILEADKSFKNKNWSTAIQQYETALTKQKDDVYAKGQISKANEKLTENKAEELAYQKILSKANAEFKASDYTAAKLTYKQAENLRPNDAYVKGKLNEIEAILNPVVVQSGPLPNLGIPTDNSIMDGEALLQKAEIERKNRKNSKLRNTGMGISDEEVSRTEAKNTQILGNQNQIIEIEKRRTEKNINDDQSRQLTIETVNNIQLFVEDDLAKNEKYKYADQLGAEEKIALMVSENSVDYTNANKQYEVNSDAVQNLDQSIQKKQEEDQHTNQGTQLQTQENLDLVNVKIAEKVLDDTESRKVTETDVRVAQGTVIALEQANENKAIGYSNDLTNSVRITESQFTEKSIEDAKVAGSNSVEATLIQVKAEDMVGGIDKLKTETIYETDHKIDQSKKIIIENELTTDDNRKISVEGVKLVNNVLNDQDRVAYDNNMVKALNNKTEITNQEIKNIGVIEQEKSANSSIVADVDRINKTALVVVEGNTINDDQQRLDAKIHIDKSDVEVSNNAVKNSAKPNENDEAIKKVNQASTDLETINNNKQTDKTLESRQLIEKYANNEVKFDEKVANALGSQYPEGVNQETFEQTDENGLLKALITRRVVVMNGYGAIYVRTQTLNGTTYSKNGVPASELIWQKETQDARLVKNY